MGERRFHFLARWQSARRSGGGQARILAGMRRHGGLPSRRGVGKSLAEWIVHGEPAADVFAMDIARYGAYASNKEYIRQTTAQFYARRFVMSYPNEQLPAGRPLKTAPAHDAMTAAGCRWRDLVRSRNAALFRSRGFYREADAEAIKRFRHSGGMQGGARARRPARYLRLRPLRGVWRQSGRVARLDRGFESSLSGSRSPRAHAWRSMAGRRGI